MSKSPRRDLSDAYSFLYKRATKELKLFNKEDWDSDPNLIPETLDELYTSNDKYLQGMFTKKQWDNMKTRLIADLKSDFKTIQGKTKKTRRKTRRKTKRGSKSKMVTGEKRYVYLEYAKGKQNKFWVAELSKKKDRIFTSWGKIGTSSSRHKTHKLGHSTPFKNIQKFNKLVQSKLKKGYVRGGTDTRPNATL